MKKILAVVFCVVALAFAATPEPAPAAATPAPSEHVPVDVMQEELAMRDSVMELRDSLCAVEKESLRNAVVIEEAKCANWEQSYQTVKKDNEVCALALGVAMEENEKKKDRPDFIIS